MSRRSGRRTYWCMDCNQYAVAGPYMRCDDCAGDEWLDHPTLFNHATPPRGLCPQCNVNESRVTGPECLDCYFSPGGLFEQRHPAPKKTPARPVYPIPAAADEITYHPRYTKVQVSA